MSNDPSSNPLKNPEYIIAFGIALISICALVVSIQQTRIMSEQRALMHQQAKASVWPRLIMGIGKSHDIDDRSVTDYRISVSNEGVGPAIIKNVKVLYKGEPKTNWWELFRAFEPEEGLKLYVTNSTISQSIIRQGDNLRILSLKNNLPLANLFYKHSEHISFEIVYESIYGDQWKYATGLASSFEETLELETPIKEFNPEESFEN